MGTERIRPNVLGVVPALSADARAALDRVSPFCFTEGLGGTVQPRIDYENLCARPMVLAGAYLKKEVACKIEWNILTLSPFAKTFYISMPTIYEGMKRDLDFSSAMRLGNALRDVYFAAIEHCDSDVIKMTAALLIQAAAVQGEFHNIADFIRDTNIRDLTFQSFQFGPKRDATLLLTKLFISMTGKTKEECLFMASKYFPLSPVPVIR